MMNSSKPKETPKKISNKRVKMNHSEIDTETSTKTNSVSDDRNKEDSESSINTQNVSTERNHSEIDTETPTKTNSVSDDRNKEDSESSISTQNVSTDVLLKHQKTRKTQLNKLVGEPLHVQCRIISEAKKISNKRVKRKQDVVQHISGKCVEDRKLFMECVGGDIDKYKYSIKLESSNLGNVWIGVEAKPSLYYYIRAKNRDGSTTTFIIDQHNKNQFDSALKYHVFSDTKFNGQGIDFEELSRGSLEYNKVGENLMINQVQNLTKKIVIDKTMIYNYWGKSWMLERFVEYLRKRGGMIQYSSHIFDGLNSDGKGGATMDDFTSRFKTSTPPNSIFTSQEMWDYLIKKRLGY